MTAREVIKRIRRSSSSYTLARVVTGYEFDAEKARRKPSPKVREAWHKRLAELKKKGGKKKKKGGKHLAQLEHRHALLVGPVGRFKYRMMRLPVHTCEACQGGPK